MKAFGTVITLIFTFALGGCATKQSVSERKINALKPLLTAGKFDVAIAVSRSEFMYDNADSVAVRKELAAYPEIAPLFKARIHAEIATQSDSGELELLPQSIKLAQRDGVLKEGDANELLQEIAKQVEILARSLHVPRHVWEGMTPEQQQSLQVKYVADAIPFNSYGTIIDAQSLNESTPGSNAGSQLGAAIGQAAYLDNAFKGNTWNYSATNQLAAGILGAVIGSMANTAPKAQFRTRYTIKLGDGKIEYVEETKSNPFRHTVGLCVAMSPIRPIEQSFCTITKEVFLSKYLPQSERQPPGGQPNLASANQPTSTSQPSESISLSDQSAAQHVNLLRAVLSPSDIAWNEGGPIVGYVAPSDRAKVSQKIEKGTSFEVQVVLKDWVKVRVSNGSMVWVEKKHLSWANSKN